jgi:hypothetical protein
MPVSQSIAPGTEVGMMRWPYQASHPDCWEKPHKGEVLPIDDLLAWHGVPADEIPEAAARMAAAGEYIPVAWSFGKVYWEPVKSLMPYAEDVAAWELSRTTAYMLERYRR